MLKNVLITDAQHVAFNCVEPAFEPILYGDNCSGSGSTVLNLKPLSLLNGEVRRTSSLVTCCPCIRSNNASLARWVSRKSRKVLNFHIVQSQRCSVNPGKLMKRLQTPTGSVFGMPR